MKRRRNKLNKLRRWWTPLWPILMVKSARTGYKWATTKCEKYFREVCLLLHKIIARTWCLAMGPGRARGARSRTGTWTLRTATGGFGWSRCPSISVIGGRRRLLIQRWGNLNQDPFWESDHPRNNEPHIPTEINTVINWNDDLRWASWGSTRSQDRSLTSTSPWPTQSARQWLGSASLTRMLW